MLQEQARSGIGYLEATLLPAQEGDVWNWMRYIQNPEVNVTLQLKRPMASAVSYLPTQNTTPSPLVIAKGQINLSVPDQVLIVELTPPTTKAPKK